MKISLPSFVNISWRKGLFAFEILDQWHLGLHSDKAELRTAWNHPLFRLHTENSFQKQTSLILNQQSCWKQYFCYQPRFLFPLLLLDNPHAVVPTWSSSVPIRSIVEFDPKWNIPLEYQIYNYTLIKYTFAFMMQWYYWDV